jgi:NADPH-dependent 2,4-dienoyl-CoA reductase/sulfur reductase-like enzyme/peroxiredoxin family protein/rhodanese-related sulfurtransferase/TusA-related sulfurtransferase
MAKKVIIVGGVAGGASCAARLRRLDEAAEIMMLEKGPYISFANCGLPYHVGGVIDQRDKLLLQTPESFHARFNVDVRVNSEVKSIDRQNKTVTVSADGREYTESYDVLVLSPGSTPVVPPFPGVANPRILALWNIPDMDKIIATMKDSDARTAVVVGGGFIGLEMAENLRHAGLEVTLVEMLEQVMPPIDFEMAQILHKHLVDNGVKLALGERVERFEERDGGVAVVTDKRTVPADIVILAIGVRPNSGLAKDSGLKINARGGIVVDEFLKTSDENIYAVGDAVETENFITHERAMIPLAGPANKMGRMAADNICGMNRKYKGTQGASVAKVFDMAVASTGLNERQLIAAGKKLNEDYKVTLIHPLSNAGYYPGGLPLSLKLLFAKEDGKVLGVQAVGYKGVEKRVDVVATAIKFGATIYDLEELELCYAPPYSSAKDPVNMAGYSADNILSGVVDNITYGELKGLPEDTVLLDVRTPAEVSMGAIPGSVNIPVDKLRSNLDTLDKSKAYVVYCAVGIRAYIACRMLLQNGFTRVRNLAGGYTTYRVASKDYSAPPESAEKEGEREVKEDKSVPMAAKRDSSTITVNACGLQCPGPVIKLYEAMIAAETGDVINITSTDPGFFSDASSWCARTKNTYLKGEKLDDSFSVWIKKGCEGESATAGACMTSSGDDKSIIVFSGDLDKALASFIIANGAAAMGRKVTLFFTFWGLNILRRRERVSVKKSFIEKMFGAMMPRGTSKLTLSKMNMLGMGSKMMKGIMKKKNVASLDELIAQAKKNGVRLVACTMSMDVMGIHEEELIDGVELAGVASFLGAAEQSDTNLFI